MPVPIQDLIPLRAAVTRSADLLREGRGLLLDLVDPGGGRDAVAACAGQDLDVTGLVRALGTWFGHPV
ncbi:hypothetical protein ACN27J_19055 [Solwaraspora sp. WMMB762]|uniref:hypothetical protein n=1 Tax=Solwaraspora sp. WMMB762 TaxID=3404120 RepID=UPI003B926A2A